MVLLVVPVVLARDGNDASSLPRPCGTLAHEEYEILDDTFVFHSGVHISPVVMQGKLLGSMLV